MSLVLNNQAQKIYSEISVLWEKIDLEITRVDLSESGPVVIKLFSRSTQLSMKF